MKSAEPAVPLVVITPGHKEKLWSPKYGTRDEVKRTSNANHHYAAGR